MVHYIDCRGTLPMTAFADNEKLLELDCTTSEALARATTTR